MREKGVKFGKSPKVSFSPMRSRCQNTVRCVGDLLEGVKVKDKMGGNRCG